MNKSVSPDLKAIAQRIMTEINAHGRERNKTQDAQVFMLAEEVGEFIGAYRRWAGMARRSGTRDELEAELADVIIGAYCVADRLMIDIDSAIQAKCEVIFSRGWQQNV